LVWPEAKSCLRSVRVVLLFALLIPQISQGESAPQLPVSDIYIVRFAEQLQSPHVVTYRVFEWTETRGQWSFPDVGYYDTGYGKEQIWFTRAGLDVMHTARFDWSQEIYFSQGAGQESNNKRALRIWPVIDAHLRSRLYGEIAAYPVIPLDAAQRWSADVDRAKLESIRIGLLEWVTAEASVRRVPGRAIPD
jgi:hypothetical protein